MKNKYFNEQKKVKRERDFQKYFPCIFCASIGFNTLNNTQAIFEFFSSNLFITNNISLKKEELRIRAVVAKVLLSLSLNLSLSPVVLWIDCIDISFVLI